MNRKKITEKNNNKLHTEQSTSNTQVENEQLSLGNYALCLNGILRKRGNLF